MIAEKKKAGVSCLLFYEILLTESVYDDILYISNIYNMLGKLQ